MFKKGQTLIIMLVVTGFVMIVLSAALVMSLTSSTLTITTNDALAANYWAEATMENGLMRFLRDPSYTGETFASGRNSAVLTVSGNGPYTFTVISTTGTSKRTLSAVATFTNGVMTVSNWRDVY